MNDRRDDERIEILFRNGTITVVGIVLSFSLGFLTTWASNPVPWQQNHLVGILPIILGILLQMKSLLDLLRYESLFRSVHSRAVRHFLIGLVLTFVGVAAAILIDLTEVAERSAS